MSATILTVACKYKSMQLKRCICMQCNNFCFILQAACHCFNVCLQHKCISLQSMSMQRLLNEASFDHECSNAHKAFVNFQSNADIKPYLVPFLVSCSAQPSCIVCIVDVSCILASFSDVPVLDVLHMTLQCHAANQAHGTPLTPCLASSEHQHGSWPSASCIMGTFSAIGQAEEPSNFSLLCKFWAVALDES